MEKRLFEMAASFACMDLIIWCLVLGSANFCLGSVNFCLGSANYCFRSANFCCGSGNVRHFPVKVAVVDVKTTESAMTAWGLHRTWFCTLGTCGIQLLQQFVLKLKFTQFELSVLCDLPNPY